MIAIIIILFLSYTSNAQAEVVKNERYYQEIDCDNIGGVVEYRLPNGTRVDCLTDKYAIEYDWAHKWAECLGQSLSYAVITDKLPKCKLIGDLTEFGRHSRKMVNIVNYYDLPLTIEWIDRVY